RPRAPLRCPTRGSSDLIARAGVEVRFDLNEAQIVGKTLRVERGEFGPRSIDVVIFRVGPAAPNGGPDPIAAVEVTAETNQARAIDRKSTRLNSSHGSIS